MSFWTGTGNRFFVIVGFFLFFCRVASIYKYYPAEIPPDSTDIYVRVLFPTNYPILVQYNSVSATFTAIDSGLVYPHYVVLQWRFA